MPNAGKTQSTGHLWPLPVRASSVCGQALPPNLGCVEVHVRVRLPCLHEAEQVVHEPHGLEMPSAAHAWLVREQASSACGQALPPTLGPLHGASTRRVRGCGTSRSGGTRTAGSVAASAWRPASMAALTTVRLRGAEPLPHELVQEDQAPQALVLQWGIEPMPHEAEPVDRAPLALVLQRGAELVPHEAVQWVGHGHW